MTQQELDKLNTLTKKYGYEFRSLREIKKYTRKVRRDIREKCKAMGIRVDDNTIRIYRTWKPKKRFDNLLIRPGLKKRYIQLKYKGD